jgi:cysteine-rich repeat protein
VLAGNLAISDGFGSAVAGLGDLDGDGTRDIAVGAAGDDDGASNAGAVYVIFLTSTGTIADLQKISATAGGFVGVLDAGDQFGNAAASVRDLDDDPDDVDELIVGAPSDDDGGVNRGAMWVLFLNPDGTVALHRKISSGLGGLVGPLDDGDMFGIAAATPRDLDGNGVADLIVGAWRDDDGGTNRGALYVLFLDGVPGAFCGDGILDPGEDCDDSNDLSGDCCSSLCDFDPEGTSCANADICDGDETCDGAGTCESAAAMACDDGDPCTQDLCDPILGCQASTGPATVCFNAARASIDIQDKPDNSRDKLSWKWSKGDEVLLADMGTPNSTTEYALCIYDGQTGSPVFSTSLDVAPGAGWTGSPTGWKFKDKVGTQEGVTSIQLKAAAAGKSKAQVKAKGMNFPTPTPLGPAMFFEQNPSVIVQLLNSAGKCWHSEFLPPSSKNEDARFKDKAP